jgi:hypothetical protein
MVSLSNDSNAAIKVSGQGQAVMMGLIYAPRGGIQLSGQGDLFGALVAGSSTANSVSLTGQGGVLYPAGLISASTVLPQALGVASWLER